MATPVLRPIAAVEVNLPACVCTHTGDALSHRTLYVGAVPEPALAATYAALEMVRTRSGIQYNVFSVEDPMMWMGSSRVTGIANLMTELARLPTWALTPPQPNTVIMRVELVAKTGRSFRLFRILMDEYRQVQPPLAKMIIDGYLLEVRILPETDLGIGNVPGDTEYLMNVMRSWQEHIRTKWWDKNLESAGSV